MTILYHLSLKLDVNEKITVIHVFIDTGNLPVDQLFHEWHAYNLCAYFLCLSPYTLDRRIVVKTLFDSNELLNGLILFKHVL